MGDISAREDEFNNITDEYYKSILGMFFDKPSEYLIRGGDDGQLVDKVARNSTNKWHTLPPIEVAAFLHAFSKVNGYYKKVLNKNFPDIFTQKLFSSRIEKIGLIQSDTLSRVYDLFRETVTEPGHVKIVRIANDNSELVYWLEHYYRKYNDLLSSEEVEGGEMIEIKVSLGVIMVHLMSLGIRPYMLERDSKKREEILKNNEDWTDKLDALFDNFLDPDSQYGYRNLVDDLKGYSRNLEYLKAEKHARQEVDALLSRLTQSPPSV